MLSGEHPGVLEGKKLMMRLLQFLFQNGYNFFSLKFLYLKNLSLFA